LRPGGPDKDDLRSAYLALAKLITRNLPDQTQRLLRLTLAALSAAMEDCTDRRRAPNVPTLVDFEERTTRVYSMLDVPHQRTDLAPTSTANDNADQTRDSSTFENEETNPFSCHDT
jgi:hypothetical protein